jgi:lipopolysaccharide/colanic/teichoic acid biosynthesis glycosyltransferase
VSGRSSIDFDEWMRLDHVYLDNWSPTYDLKIMLSTIPAVLLGKGAC